MRASLIALCGVALMYVATGPLGPEYPDNLSQTFSRGLCDERGPVRFTSAPAEPDDLAHIYPLGQMTGSHVTPTDHQYYYWASLDAPLARYVVRSPADGVVIAVNYQGSDYRLVIEHSCHVYTIWIHLERLAGPLAHLNGTISFDRPTYERIRVSAGEAIAYDGGTNGFDFSVHDARVLLPGFVRPESYEVEPWKVHTVDPNDYFDEPARSRLLGKNVRQVDPLGGKIDHDVPGTLMGNWFVEGTDGYRGIVEASGPIAPNESVGYWSTHLAVAPDPIDPTVIIVSMPSFGDSRAQLPICELDPHPADVTVETGLVKYELVGWSYVRRSSGEPWHGISREAFDDIIVQLYPDHVDGVVLFQLIDDHRLKFEAFPARRGHQVEGFTEAAVIYER
jgi:hypothetical protein